MSHSTSLRRHGHAKTQRSLVLSALHPAYRSGRSIFPSRVYDVDEVQRVLKDGHQSRKIGKTVAKGHRRGWPIFTLTLEERATCPRDCKAWAFCYGNHMQAAERIVAGPELEETLWNELLALQFAHPGGFLVRLHVLGDFYSAAYVKLWRRALDAFPALHVFGFTARQPSDEIGQLLWELSGNRWDRFSVRFSGMAGETMASQLEDHADPMAIGCPAQTGATECCGTCALCWSTDRSISFARH